jgi:hypothetical protein
MTYQMHAATSLECTTGEYKSSTTSIEGHEKVPVYSWMVSGSGGWFQKKWSPALHLFDGSLTTDWMYVTPLRNSSDSLHCCQPAHDCLLLITLQMELQFDLNQN